MTNNSITNVRQSNFELLRIVSMAMVVVWHFILKCLLVGSPDGPVVSDSLCSVEGGGNYVQL